MTIDDDAIERTAWATLVVKIAKRFVLFLPRTLQYSMWSRCTPRVERGKMGVTRRESQSGTRIINED